VAGEAHVHNSSSVFRQDHFYLAITSGSRSGTPLWIAVAVGVLTLAVATCAAFAISRLKSEAGRIRDERPRSSTYFIPAAFLGCDVQAMGTYAPAQTAAGRWCWRWSPSLALCDLGAEAGLDKLPWELDEAARIDGATARCSCFAWSMCR